MAKTYDLLMQECLLAKTNITKACTRAGVNRGVIAGWKDKEPRTLEILAELRTAIQELAAENGVEVPEIPGK